MTSPAAHLASSQATAPGRKKLAGSGARIQNRASVLSSALTCCPQRPASSPVEGDGSEETQVQLLPLSLPGHVTPDGQNRRLMLLAGGALPPLLSFSLLPPRDHSLLCPHGSPESLPLLLVLSLVYGLSPPVSLSSLPPVFPPECHLHESSAHVPFVTVALAPRTVSDSLQVLRRHLANGRSQRTLSNRSVQNPSPLHSWGS